MFSYLTKKLGKVGILPWIVFVFLLFYAKRAAAKGFKQVVVPGITPTNTDNWFYRGVNAVGDVFNDGDGNNDNWSLGTWIFDMTRGKTN